MSILGMHVTRISTVNVSLAALAMFAYTPNP